MKWLHNFMLLRFLAKQFDNYVSWDKLVHISLEYISVQKEKYPVNWTEFF